MYGSLCNENFFKSFAVTFERAPGTIGLDVWPINANLFIRAQFQLKSTEFCKLSPGHILTTPTNDRSGCFENVCSSINELFVHEKCFEILIWKSGLALTPIQQAQVPS